MAGVTGDFRKLAQLRAAFEKVRGREFRAELSRKMGEAGLQNVQRSFSTSTDPYGRRWPRVARRGRHGRRTGAARLGTGTAYRTDVNQRPSRGFDRRS